MANADCQEYGCASRRFQEYTATATHCHYDGYAPPPRPKRTVHKRARHEDIKTRCALGRGDIPVKAAARAARDYFQALSGTGSFGGLTYPVRGYVRRALK